MPDLQNLLERPIFQWDKDSPETLGKFLTESARNEAETKITDLNLEIALTPNSVVEKIRSKAESWKREDILEEMSKQDEDLETFLNELTSIRQAIREQIQQTKNPEEILIARAWVADTLIFETKPAIRRKKDAETKKAELKKQALSWKINKLRTEPDKKYRDLYNKLVCTRLDNMEAQRFQFLPGQSKLKVAEEDLKSELLNSITDKDLEEYVFEKALQERKRNIERFIRVGMQKCKDPKDAENFAISMFQINERRTDQVWQSKKKRFEDILSEGLSGTPINFITMLCCINEFDMQGSYRLVPDLNKYFKNPKLEPVPLILDELLLVIDFFGFYGIKADLTVYISDTDYTEIRQFGNVTTENLANLTNYIDNVTQYVSGKNPSVKVCGISQLTNNNPLYEEVKNRIKQNIKDLRGIRRTNFAEEWYLRFERSFEKIWESIAKRGLFKNTDRNKKTQEVLTGIWSVNGAQGAVFGRLGDNTILLSTERRERDTNYVLDKETRNSFCTVLYILRAAEAWNRKLVQKS